MKTVGRPRVSQETIVSRARELLETVQPGQGILEPLAKEFGMHRDSVGRILRKAGLNLPAAVPKASVTFKIARLLMNSGKGLVYGDKAKARPMEAIAAEVGCTKGMVSLVYQQLISAGFEPGMSYRFVERTRGRKADA